MATNPTRQQQQACDHLAEALRLVVEAARLDGKMAWTIGESKALLALLAKAVGPFDGAEITRRALIRRVRAMGLPESAAELLTLLEGQVQPLEMLMWEDEKLKERVAELEEELGDV